MITLLYFLATGESFERKVSAIGGALFVIILMLLAYDTFKTITAICGTVAFGFIMLDCVYYTLFRRITE